MAEIEVSSLGSVTYWRLPNAEIEHEKLVEVWTDHGLPESLLPKPPRPSKALRRAVSDVKEARRLARPLKRGSAWAIVDEQVVGERDLEHKIATRATLETDTVSGQVHVITDGNGLGQRISEGFERQLGRQRAHDVSMLLIRSVFHCGGVSLRENGGVYFIPAVHHDFWRQVSATVEILVPGAAVYQLETRVEEASVRAVLDALKAEANAEMSTLKEELQREGDDAPGPRALRHRIERVDALKLKVAGYESLLSHSLPDLQQGLTALRALVVEAEAIATEGTDQMDLGPGY